MKQNSLSHSLHLLNKKFIRMQLGLVKLSIFLVTMITQFFMCLSVELLVNIWLLCVNTPYVEACECCRGQCDSLLIKNGLNKVLPTFILFHVGNFFIFL